MRLIKRILHRIRQFALKDIYRRLEEAGRRLDADQNAIEQLVSYCNTHPSLAASVETPNFRFYGQFSPPVDKFIYERYFADTNIKGILVECGAYDGLTECSCKFFEETMDWVAYNIEPVPWIYEELCRNRPKAHNYTIALSNQVGTAKFQAVIHPDFGDRCTNGSLRHTASHAKWLDEIGCKTKEIECRTTTWRQFVHEAGLRHVDRLVLDVEGNELDVISGMEGADVLPEIICVEIGHLPFDEVRQALQRLGYTYDTSSHVNAFFVKPQHIVLSSSRRLCAVSP